ncbi:hypothetical protein CAEBREN_03542 [Caenorhabditis brenneri]|uniref:Transcription factor AP-2 C-terminal domain-containing protein n=1 Tax=Caenorhabditis brenneri TaxID=135651 RepID=G0M929_CAEBE|nr:hypothetical protein CAEBREN_03542 [Caenorhabditis brenneri]
MTPIKPDPNALPTSSNNRPGSPTIDALLDQLLAQHGSLLDNFSTSGTPESLLEELLALGEPPSTSTFDRRKIEDQSSPSTSRTSRSLLEQMMTSDGPPSTSTFDRRGREDQSSPSTGRASKSLLKKVSNSSRTSKSLLKQMVTSDVPPSTSKFDRRKIKDQSSPSTSRTSKSLLEDLETSDGPLVISDFDRREIEEELRRLYALAEELSRAPEKKSNAPAKETNGWTVDTIPDGFTKLQSDAVPFDIVRGRLELSHHSGPSYKVTPEEIRRRIEGVEQLNTSNMANNLKKQKQKNGGEIMRAQLAEHGIQMSLQTYRGEAPTRVISLVEGEALHLAADLQKICIQEYPARQIAEEVIEEAKNKRDVMEALLDTTSFLECMSAMEDALKSVDPPLSGVVPKASKNQTLNHSQEKFSCATHGLGIATQRIWVVQMKRIGEEMAAIFEQRRVNVEIVKNKWK